MQNLEYYVQEIEKYYSYHVRIHYEPNQWFVTAFANPANQFTFSGSTIEEAARGALKLVMKRMVYGPYLMR